MNDKNVYNDIINTTSYKSTKRKPMSREMRAAQFAPFAALTGYDASVNEAGRLTDKKIEIDEYMRQEISFKLNVLMEENDSFPYVTVCYFKPDRLKDGGEYVTKSGLITKIDEISKEITFDDGVKIDVSNILTVDSDIFDVF